MYGSKTIRKILAALQYEDWKKAPFADYFIQTVDKDRVNLIDAAVENWRKEQNVKRP